MRILNDIFDWLISSGALGAAIIFAWKYVKPWLDSKVAANQAHRSNMMWQLLDSVAETAVNSLVSQNMTGNEKFSTAVNNVQQTMLNAGAKVKRADVETAVQAAYEKSELTPTVEINKEGK